MVGAAVASAQGRGATQRPPKVAAQAPKARPQGPKPVGTRGQQKTIAANIAKSPQLEARLKAMLPAGMTMAQASEGFRNQGQFIAALEASKNNNIDFVRLKAEMTGDDALSLGQAVQKLKPAESTNQ
jgi:hypothetical protein